MIKIYYAFNKIRDKFFRFEGKYEKSINPDPRVLNTGFELFMIIIELKQQYPFSS